MGRQRPRTRASSHRWHDDRLSSPSAFIEGLCCGGSGARRYRRREPTGSAASAASRASVGKKVIVIGIDGMDPRLCREHDEGGLLPNLAKLSPGGFSDLGTSIPPQSPVAWANFINGAGPGSHGIFDFIHRHPQRASATRSIRPPRPSRRGLLGSGRLPAAARFLAVQSQACRRRSCAARACRSGTISTPPASRPRFTICRRTIRRAPRSTATTAASAAWERPTCWAPTARISTSPRTRRPDGLDEGGGRRSRLVFDGETARAKLVGPENSCS